MKPLQLWAYEVRRAGPAALAGPPAIASAITLFSLVAAQMGTREGNTARFLMSGVEMGIPLAAGVTAATLVGRDRAVEIQLTVPTSYRSTLLRRLAVTTGWAAICAVAVSALLVATGWWQRWPGSHDGLEGQLTWLAPTLWLTALGLLAAALLRSVAAATSIVALVWTLEQAFAAILQQDTWSRMLFLFATTRGAVPADWLANRMTLVASALVLAALAWPLLGSCERLLGGEVE